MTIAWFEATGLVALSALTPIYNLLETAVYDEYARWCERGRPKGIPRLDFCAQKDGWLRRPSLRLGAGLVPLAKRSRGVFQAVRPCGCRPSPI